jgi:hypothetical protein
LYLSDLNQRAERQREADAKREGGRDPNAEYPEKGGPGARLADEDKRALRLVPFVGDGDDPLDESAES